ncbi:MAG: hypothetical protein ACHREM_09705 [Polyangiales bacterium]
MTFPSRTRPIFATFVLAAEACGTSNAHLPAPPPSDANATGQDAGDAIAETTSADTTSADTTSADTGSADTTIADTAIAETDEASTVDTGGIFTEAPHLPFPNVVDWGGKLITAPKVVTITFGSDPFAAQFAAFGVTAASSAWWDLVRVGDCDPTGASCVGDGPAGVSVAVSSAAASYTDSMQGAASTLQTALSDLITAGTVPAPDANTIYVMYLPGATKITMDPGVPSLSTPYNCPDTFGYHNSMSIGASEVFYAVVLECPVSGGITVLQNSTETAAHEILETATDSDGQEFYIDTNDPGTWGWSDIQGGELADLCDDPFGLGMDGFTEGGFLAQRIWSIPAAKAGKNPCVPVPTGEIYFNASPAGTAVLEIEVGASKTIEVDAFSDAPMSDWTLTAQDWTDVSTTYLSFSISGVTPGDAGPEVQVNNGSKVQLTVTLKADPAGSSKGEADGVLVSANGGAAPVTQAHFWPFIVLTPAAATDAGIAKAKHHAPMIGRSPVRKGHRAKPR